jgi:hypothetical protein
MSEHEQTNEQPGAEAGQSEYQSAGYTNEQIQQGLAEQTQLGLSAESLDTMQQAYEDVPDSPSGYNFEYPHGLEIDPETDSAGREVMHAVGLPRDLANYVQGAWNNSVINPVSVEDHELSARETESQLRAEWGADYEVNVNLARSFIDRLNPEQQDKAKGFLEQSGLGNDIYLIRRLVNLARVRAGNS